MATSRFEQRRDRLWKLVKEKGTAGMLVTDEVNVTYLTGFTGDSSYLLLTADEAIVLSDPRYTEQLGTECRDVELEIRRPGTQLTEILPKVVVKAGCSSLAFEADSVTVALHKELGEKLTATQFVPTSGLVEQLRQIKDKAEIEEIRAAISLAERAFAVVKAGLRPEQTEREVAFELEHQIRLFGGQGCSFSPIVGVGPHGALPHYRAGDARIGDDAFVLIDWGAKGRQYVSDLTRILVTAKIPPKLERIYGVVLRAQLQAIAAIRPGVKMLDVDAAARNVITKAGYGEEFGHSLGHGIGLQIHEAPRLAMKQEELLQPGMVVTVEPGIYLPGWGGVRIEDDILVTKTGHEVLSHLPKNFADCVI